MLKIEYQFDENMEWTIIFRHTNSHRHQTQFQHKTHTDASEQQVMKMKMCAIYDIIRRIEKLLKYFRQITDGFHHAHLLQICYMTPSHFWVFLFMSDWEHSLMRPYGNADQTRKFICCHMATQIRISLHYQKRCTASSCIVFVLLSGEDNKIHIDH